jgi:FkbM family methyltransferase
MLNLAAGHPSVEDGRSFITADGGRREYAIIVHGPYEFRETGSYMVEFTIELAADPVTLVDPVCAMIEVMTQTGEEVIAQRKIRLSELRLGSKIRLYFTLRKSGTLEYRGWTSGMVAIRMAEHRRVYRLDELPDVKAGGHEPLFFPDETADTPPFFREHRATFRTLYDNGFEVDFVGEDTVLRRDGMAFHVRSTDDFMFIGEVFQENVYNILLDRPCCVIDVGMNVGYTTLRFARSTAVQEVLSFEPFPDTFHRAAANLAINPDLAPKIDARCAGLSDKDWNGEIKQGDGAPSGSGTVVVDMGDRPVAVALLDAADALRPILDRAAAQGWQVICKIDCEGSEFAIFRSLEAAGLLPRFDAFMVEWHAMFSDQSQTDIIAPLRRAGFIVFDRSPPVGNGFFYAVRLAPPASV